jgi:hypothetical protein
MDKRIIADSIKDHLIRHFSPLKSPKKMTEALNRLFEGKKHQQKDGVDDLDEECEASRFGVHSLLLLESEPDQGTD